LPAFFLAKQEPTIKPLGKGETAFKKTRVFLLWFIYFTFSGLATFILGSLLQVYIKMRYQVSMMEIGFIYSLERILFFLKPIIGYIGDKVSQLPAVITLQIAAAALYAVMPFTSLPEFVAALVALYFIGMNYDIIFKSLLIKMFPRKTLGTVYGVRGTAYELSMIIAPAIAGFMLEYNYVLMFQIVTLLTVAQILLLIIASKKSIHRTSEEPLPKIREKPRGRRARQISIHPRQ